MGKRGVSVVYGMASVTSLKIAPNANALWLSARTEHLMIANLVSLGRNAQLVSNLVGREINALYVMASVTSLKIAPNANAPWLSARTEHLMIANPVSLGRNAQLVSRKGELFMNGEGVCKC